MTEAETLRQQLARENLYRITERSHKIIEDLNLITSSIEKLPQAKMLIDHLVDAIKDLEAAFYPLWKEAESTQKARGE